MTTPLSAFADIADRYDGFIFDVWGTLYDGGNAFPEALETVRALAGLDKKMLVLSNSPRIPAIVGERLTGIGFDLAWRSATGCCGSGATGFPTPCRWMPSQSWSASRMRTGC